MLKITVPAVELWNEQLLEFMSTKKQDLTLEHSLVSISKWESKWKKPFLSDRKEDEKTREETIDYVRCMTLTQNVDPNVYTCLTNKNIEEINNYIRDPMSATWFNDKKQVGPSRIVTSELIYSWMIKFGIPMECQKWHLNRLLTLIRVCKEEAEVESGARKMSKSEILRSNAALNAARKKRLNTKG